MENCSDRENAADDEAQRTAIVGLGNPIYGDDAVGVIVARSVFDILSQEMTVQLVESPCSGFGLSERLMGYPRAVIIDALIDARREVGTVNRVEVLKHSGGAPASMHTTGFQDVLALARLVGMTVPDTIRIYGIVIREPPGFSEGLSPELAAKVSEIASAVAGEETRNIRSLHASAGGTVCRK